MVDKLKKIWLEGELVDWDDAKIHVLTHTMHYGLGAFEGIRAYRRADESTTIFRLKDHVERLYDTCKLVMLEPRFTREQVADACSLVMQSNKMNEAYLRPLIFVGDGAMGVYAPDNPVRTFVAAWRWGAYLGDKAITEGIRAKISSWARHHIHVSLAKGKIMGQYTNSIMAKREAKMAGYDEAILMDTSGYVSEGSGENLFLVKKGKLFTPPLSASILAGITRDTVLTLAREEGIPVAEEMITRDQLYLADEVFFTGTAAEVTPIREVDNRKIGEGTMGPVTRRIQQRYFDVVKGTDDSHPEWLTRVKL
jgi:branched-chain amino acid aminotransferase